jgi:Family of unknown function (DUF5681)
MAQTKDYDVGYGKPPKQNQFKPGQSGNPRGRLKGTRNCQAELQEELAELTTIKEADRDITVSKQRACVKALVAAAMHGNLRACGVLLSLCARLDAADSENDSEELAPEDREILDAFTARQSDRHPSEQGGA